MGSITGQSVAQRAVIDRGPASERIGVHEAGPFSTGRVSANRPALAIGSGLFSCFRPFPFTLSVLDVVSKQSVRMVDEAVPPPLLR